MIVLLDVVWAIPIGIWASVVALVFARGARGRIRQTLERAGGAGRVRATRWIASPASRPRSRDRRRLLRTARPPRARRTDRPVPAPSRADRAIVRVESLVGARCRYAPVLLRLGRRARRRSRPCARSQPRARGRGSGSTVTPCFMSRSESRTFSSVIIFMYRQTASSRTGSNVLLRHLLLEPVEDAGLGRDEEPLLRRAPREVDHALGREDLRPLVARTPSPGSRSRTRDGRAARRRARRAASARCRPAGCRRARGTRRARSSACGR